jgi:hypothetical protein
MNEYPSMGSIHIIQPLGVTQTSLKNHYIFIGKLLAAISCVYWGFWKGDIKSERNGVKNIQVSNYPHLALGITSYKGSLCP